LVVEDLGVANMIRNPKLSRCIADVSWGAFLNMLDYKTRWYGSELQRVDRFYPSSQTCSGCGHRQPIQIHIHYIKWPSTAPLASAVSSL
jgi:putative transposase